MKMYPLTKADLLLLKRSFKYVRPFKLKFMSVFTLIVLNILFGILEPILWGRILVCLFENDIENVLRLVLYVVLLNIAGLSSEFGKEYLFSYLSENILFALKKDIYKIVLNLPVKAFDQIKTGEFMSRINHDSNIIANFLSSQILSDAVNIFKVLLVGVAMFTVSLPLAFIVVGSFPFSYIIFVKFGKVLRRKSAELLKLNDIYYGFLSESIYGIREIVILGIKKVNYKQFKIKSADLKKRSIKMSVLNSASELFTQMINLLSHAAVLIVGAFLIISKSLSMDLFIAFSSYSRQFTDALMSLAKMNSELQKIMASLERQFFLLDNLSYKKQQYGSYRVQNIIGSIKLRNINFGYNKDTLVLKNVNLTIKPNINTAIVGRSGSGKTTIFNLLLRLYNLNSGMIYIDNIRLKDFEEKTLRKHISVVRQEPFIFEATIRENLLLANEHASMEEIEKACEASCLGGFISNLPMKYETIIGENAVNLSGGQKQRLAIARALLKKSKIILFDEATSSLDNESQLLIKRAISSISRKHTILTIAHRLSTIIEADQIVVLENGKVVGQGTHSYLLKHNNIYKYLFDKELNLSNPKKKIFLN